MKLKWFGLAGMLGLLLSGCSYYAQFDNFKHAEQLRLGMSRDEVRQIMGEPLDVPFAKHDVWYYYIETHWHDCQSTIDECMPIVFKNDKVVGWGKDYVNQQRLVKRPYERPEIEGVR